MTTEPIRLEMVTREGPNCPVCSASLSWLRAGVYVCDICKMADKEGKTIEEVRADVEALAHEVNSRLGDGLLGCLVEFKNGDRGIIHMEPEGPPPPLPWGPIDEEWRAWQDANAARAAELQGDDG
jgi:hypothetical protein